MRKFATIIWFLLSLAPLFIVPSMMVGMGTGFSEDSSDSFDKSFNMALALNVLMLMLLASFIFYLYRSDNVPKNKRGLWLAVLLFANPISMPFFWYWYVWGPLKKEDCAKLGESYRPSKVIPMLMGLAMFSIIPVTIALMNYQEAKTSEFIADAFPSSENDQVLNEITSGKISISRKLAALHTRYYRKSMNVYTSSNSVVFKPSSVFSFHKSFEIPASAIHSCSKQCGGSTDYILMVDSLDIEIDLEDAPDLLEWCWENKLPILSSKDRRQWLYKGIELPSKVDLAESLVSKNMYQQKSKTACQGF